MASLKKFQIIAKLYEKYRITIKSSQQLNKVLAEMGLIVKDGGFWKTTAKGSPFSIYGTQVLNGDLWRDHIVDAIAEYLGKK